MGTRTTAGPPWKILRPLGAGGMGEVFLALTPEGHEVAVKILRSSEKASLRSFEQEARLLTRLRHPAIARVEGFLTDSKKIFGEDRGPCFWMELVAGTSILDAARNSGAEKILGWLKSALEALQALQAQSISHGDLSPSNLLVTPGGQIKLIDFGMAGEFSAPPPKSAGTLPYLAPERIHGKNFPSSEIFSLGVIFYQALAGKHPRAECRSLAELLSRKARPLLEAAPELKKGFAVPARVIDRMVELDPSRRFANAEEVLRALRGIETTTEGPKSTPYYPIRMFGAEAAWEKAQAALSAAASKPAWLWIHGPSGVGKSRFLSELAFQGALEGISFEEVSLAQLSRKMAEADSGVRAFVVPGLEKLPTDALQPLLRLKREGLPPKCLLVLEWNDDFLPDSSQSLLGLLRVIPEAREISLGHLSPEDTRRLSFEALGEAAGAAAHRVLYESTGGHPQMLLELAGLLRKQGVTDKRHFSREWLEGLARFHSFEDLLLFRLRELPAEERKILAYLAAAEAPQGLEALAAALNPVSPDGGDRPGLRRLLERLCERNLLRRDPTVDLYSLFLPALRQALLLPLSRSEVDPIHRNWLASLPALPEQAAARLHHALALGDKNTVASLALAGVEAKKAAGLKSEALSLAEQALPFLEIPADRSRLLRLQANLLIEADRYAEALEAAEAAFALAADDEPLALKTAKYYLTTGILHQNLGRDAEAKERFARCLDLVGPGAGPELQAYRVRAQALLGMQELREGQTEKALRHFREGLASPACQGTRAAELRRNMAAALAQKGDWAGGRDNLGQARSLYREAAYPAGEFATWLQEGNLALDQNDPELAASCYREAESLARELQDELFLSRVWNNLGVLARRRMELGSALSWFNPALEILRTLGNRSDLAESLEQSARAEAAAGRFARAEELIQELRRSIPSFGADQSKAERAEAFLNGVRSGHWTQPAVDRAWDLEARLQNLAMQKKFEELKKTLLEIEAKLPPLIQVTFAERHDYRRQVAEESDVSQMVPSKRNTPMEILENLSAINRELLQEDDMDRVLHRLMDAAMRLSRAENGFLVLRSEAAEGPIPGFSVVVAQNVDKQAFDSAEFAFSLSAIRRAMESGQSVVTDNALQDPRFSQAKSVELHALKSILALPVMGRRGVLGAFYLDHRFEIGLFGEEILAVMRAFADQAALALQKGQMIEELKKTNRGLVDQVEEQSDRLHRMQMELAESRLKLKYEYSEIVGRSPKMLETLSLVDKITDSKIAVWIFGESGTGKESIARALHFNSARAKHPFVTENCSALPENLMESELFGHKKGAFTHADRDKKGILEYADHGTIFLDEIADLSLHLQAKLLRFLQEGEIRPLGSNEVVQVDVRVVSASNKDLQELVAQGKFREDLYFRLNGVTVSLPPLRERMEDLPLLAEHILKKFARREGKEPCRLNLEAMRQFINYPWPGNIRELQNTLETAALFAENGAIGLKALAFKPILLGSRKSMKHLAMKSVAKEAMDPELEKILLAIRDHGYHKGNAASALGISRRNLYSKLEKFEVPVELKELKAYIDARFI